MLLLCTGEGWAQISEGEDGPKIFLARQLDRVFVQLSAAGSRAHGPALRITLLSHKHPDVLQNAAYLAGERRSKSAFQSAVSGQKSILQQGGEVDVPTSEGASEKTVLRDRKVSRGGAGGLDKGSSMASVLDLFSSWEFGASDPGVQEAGGGVEVPRRGGGPETGELRELLYELEAKKGVLAVKLNASWSREDSSVNQKRASLMAVFQAQIDRLRENLCLSHGSLELQA